MALELPSTLSPSKVSTFRDCALAFRFSAIDKVPEPPSAPAMKGTLVHRALELLLDRTPSRRTEADAAEAFRQATKEMFADDEFALLGLDAVDTDGFVADAERMLGRYFTIEDPTTVVPIGLELMLEVPVGGVRLRGIIDRLELDSEGGLVVTDYKTGRTPGVQQEASRLGGVHFYALMCERLFGRRPSVVQLIYLGAQPQVIRTIPTEQSVAGIERRIAAMWTAIERSCEREDFRPRPSALCNWCSFKEFCPAFGGDPSLAPSRLAQPAAGAALSL